MCAGHDTCAGCEQGPGRGHRCVGDREGIERDAWEALGIGDAYRKEHEPPVERSIVVAC